MGFIDKIKHFFFPVITGDKANEEKLVTKIKMKKDLRVNAEVEVSPDHKLVTCFYNKPCDVLESGLVKVTDSQMPILFKNNQAKALKDGKEKLKYLKADLYFVNEKEAKDIFFTTSESVPLYVENTKIKAKLHGQFSFKIVDSFKFMSYLLEDYATIKLYTAYKETMACLGEEMTKIIYRVPHSLVRILKDDKPIYDEWIRQLSSLEDRLGIKVTDIKIYNITTSRKYQEKLEDARVSVRVEEELLKQAEQTVNSIEEEKELVPVTVEHNETNISSASKEQEPHKVLDEEPQDVMENIHEEAPNDAPLTFVDTTSEELIKTADEDEIAQSVEGKAPEVPPLTQKDANEVKLCPSCGAGNSEDAKVCIVCGSKF